MVSSCKIQESPRPPSLLTPTASSRGAQTTFRFSSSLEGLAGLREAVILAVTVYYSEQAEIKASPGKRHKGRTGGTRCELPVVLLLGSCRQRSLLLPACGACCPHGGSPEPRGPEFSRGLVRRHSWPEESLTLVFSPQEAQLILRALRGSGLWSFLSEALVLVAGLCWPQSELGSVPISSIFWKTLQRTGVNSSLSVWSQWSHLHLGFSLLEVFKL